MSTVATRAAASSRPWARFASSDPADVVPRLLALLLIPLSGGWVTVGGVGAATIVASTPRLMRSTTLWLAVGSARLLYELTEWHGVDDHEVLISYTCIAYGLALWTADPRRTARWTLPVLVGLTMLFATGWKIGSGQFLDGDTMRYTLLTDPRFDLAGSWFGGMDDAARAANDAAVTALRDPAGPDHVVLTEPLLLTVFAQILTAGAILVEGALAIVFLRPGTSPLLRARLLALFCLTTYVIVPVSRFGLVLIVGAYAGSESRRDRLLLLGAAAFCIAWPPLWVALGGTQ